MMTIEIIKTDKVQVEAFLMLNGYQRYPIGINTLATHHTKPDVTHIANNSNGINLKI
jgi:hypothetical protein